MNSVKCNVFSQIGNFIKQNIKKPLAQVYKRKRLKQSDDKNNNKDIREKEEKSHFLKLMIK